MQNSDYVHLILQASELSQVTDYCRQTDFTIDSYATNIAKFSANQHLTRLIILIEKTPYWALFITKQADNKFIVQLTNMKMEQSDCLKIASILYQATPNIIINFQPIGEISPWVVFSESVLQFAYYGKLGSITLDIQKTLLEHELLLRKHSITWYEKLKKDDLNQANNLIALGNRLIKFLNLLTNCQQININELTYQECRILQKNYQQFKISLFQKKYTIEEVFEKLNWQGLVKFNQSITTQQTINCWETVVTNLNRKMSNWESELTQKLAMKFNWIELTKYSFNQIYNIVRRSTLIETGGQLGHVVGSFYNNTSLAIKFDQILKNAISSFIEFSILIVTLSPQFATRTKNNFTETWSQNSSKFDMGKWLGYGIGIYSTLSLGGYLFLKNIISNIIILPSYYYLIQPNINNYEATVQHQYHLSICDPNVASRIVLLLFAGIESIYFSDCRFLINGVGSIAGSIASVRLAKPLISEIERANTISSKNQALALSFIISQLGVETGRFFMTKIADYVEHQANKQALCAYLQHAAKTSSNTIFNTAEFKCIQPNWSPSYWLSNNRSMSISWLDETSIYYEADCEAEVTPHGAKISCSTPRVKYLLD